MAQTTLATSMSLIKDTVLRELIFEFFVKSDPLIARMPMLTPDGGYRWRQEFVASHAAATDFGHWDTFAATAFTVSEYQGFLNGISKMDQRNRALSALSEGQQGRNDRLTKKQEIIAELSKLWRSRVVTGEPATSAIGATLQALLGASATVELGPRTFDFDDVHQIGGTTSTTQGSFNWVNATQTLSYMAPGDTAYGPGQVISASNWYRVPLFSGGSVTGSKNPAKWIRVTCDPVATIMAAGNYTSAATALTCVTFTPSKQMTGFYRQVSPDQMAYHDLTGTLDPDSPTTAVGNGPAAGGSLNRSNLTWMKQKLLDASNDDPSRCCILMSDNLLNYAEGLLTSLGHGIDPVMFMGRELAALSYGGIPILRNKYLSTSLTSRDASRSDLTVALGLCLGGDNAHVKYQTLAGDVINDSFSDLMVNAVAQGDGTPGAGTPIPVTYWETPYSSTSLTVNQIGHMLGEPFAGLKDLCMLTHLYNG